MSEVLGSIVVLNLYYLMINLADFFQGYLCWKYLGITFTMTDTFQHAVKEPLDVLEEKEVDG